VNAVCFGENYRTF